MPERPDMKKIQESANIIFFLFSIFPNQKISNRIIKIVNLTEGKNLVFLCHQRNTDKCELRIGRF